MWNKVRNWFHHLFNPHCLQCKIEENEKIARDRNLVIDEYRELLASARLEIGRLTQALVDLTKKPDIIEQKIESNFKPLPRKLSISEAAAKLTRESHEEAMRLRREKAKEHDELRNESNDLKQEVQALENKLGIQ